MESAFLEFSFLNLKNNPSVKGKRLKTIMRSYLKVYPNALNAKKNSEDEILIMSKNMLSLNEKTDNITISNAAYDARV
jgi:hypothetical protein|tara:strand:+ start:66 stop:299 length:234 start_codon:yes stop_codon:yes gene_type:complete